MTTFIDIRKARGASQKKPPSCLTWVNIDPYDVMTS